MINFTLKDGLVAFTAVIDGQPMIIDLRNYVYEKSYTSVGLMYPTNFHVIRDAEEAIGLGLNVKVPEPEYAECVAVTRQEFDAEAERVFRTRYVGEDQSVKYVFVNLLAGVEVRERESAFHLWATDGREFFELYLPMYGVQGMYEPQWAADAGVEDDEMATMAVTWHAARAKRLFERDAQRKEELKKKFGLA
jgi:hypothetical protein